MDKIEIKVFGTPREIADDDLRGHTAVVVDVLRSSSTVATALSNGARELIPVSTPAEAAELASRMGRGLTLLCGEREGRKIDGFDLGNCPAEFTAEKVTGRVLIFASTNGAPTIVKARAAEHVYWGGYNNFSAVTEQVASHGKPVALLCSGKFEHFSFEDFVCAGKFVEGIQSALGVRTALSDSARAALILYRKFADDIISLHESCNHGRYLMEIGFAEDLEYCARIDTHPIVPVFVEGKVKAYRPNAPAHSETVAATA